MKNDKELLDFYLELRGPEAQPWNLSPESLYLEYVTRDYIKKHLKIFEGIQVCNVGIGVGEWDDYLGYLLVGKGELTSIDIDSEICGMFQYRQMREAHPNASKVLCMDILNSTIPSEQFDVVTIIGSTVRETGEYKKTLRACIDLVRTGGHLIYMDFLKNHSEEKFIDFIKETELILEDITIFDSHPSVSCFLSKTKKVMEAR
ncbi:methyltransferase domain-containing protein [Alicyclobacillus fodiniaquatilis]|uniref:Methyltransferase domain-containing protein n=1 Tax=Alicyclobacillus fodiniaquatilis TaxID=1661150 RepID=A0ABW4JIP4_9BACL